MQGRIGFDTGDAEAWTWRKLVTGWHSCRAPGAEAVVRVNGERVPVEHEGERFWALARLGEGKHRITASCRHQDGTECCSVEITLRQRLTSRPTALIRVSVGPSGVVLDGRESRPSEATHAPIIGYAWRQRRGNPARLRALFSGDDARAAFGPPGADGEYSISLSVRDAEGRSDTVTTCVPVERGRPRPVDWERENPAWVEQAVIYGVVPHNFGRPGFLSVVEKLDYLRDLGINAMWLAPCNQTPGRGHGYAVTDYFRLRKDYGTKAEFRKLVREAHARGIRVLMDFVPNHTSLEHPYMRHAEAQGPASPYHSFYDRDREGRHTHYFHWSHLPNLNYDHPEVRRMVLEACCYWVREFDVDGFRVDAAWGVKLRRPDFWPAWRRELKRIKPDLLLLAEASARDPYWFGHGFDAAYDWTDELGHWAMEQVFEDREQIVQRLHAALTNEGRGYHEDALVFRFLNNNDTGTRFITRHGLEMERVAAAMLLTLPGLPCIYTGQEVGAEFDPPRRHEPICWEDRHGLRDYYRKLIALRKRVASLHSRKWRILGPDAEQQVYSYVRYGDAGDAPALVVLNFSGKAAEVELKLPEDCRGLAAGGVMEDVPGDERIRVTASAEGALLVPLPGHSARVLMRPGAVGGK